MNVLLQHLRRRILRRWLLEKNDSVSVPKSLPSTGPGSPGPHVRRTPVRSHRREWFLHGLLAFAAMALICRLVHLQWICQSWFQDRAFRQQISEEPVLARPGDVLDREGRLLATTILVPSLYACPAKMEDIPGVSRLLAAALHLDAAELQQRLENNAHREFLWIRRRLTDDEAAAVRSLALSRRIIGFRREFQRHYPQGALAAHVLGTRNIDGIGQGGIEESLDHLLKGTDGIRRFVRDARGYVLSILEEVTRPPIDGTSVTLTLDVRMQFCVERQLDQLMSRHQARGACAIVMNPRNGDVLALACRPAFDPNHPDRASPDAWKNMATAAVFEPGSTFKPLVVAWALDHHIIQRDDQFDCEHGAYRMGRRILHDHHHYDELSLTDVLVKSSNIGMAKIGERLGNKQLYQLAAAFGFGQRTGIELPGELTGLLRPLEKWNRYSTGSIPMGQELAATPIQMITAHAALANGGVRVGPHLVMNWNDSARPHPQIYLVPVVDRDVADWIVQHPLVEVVRRGTGKLAQLKDVEVFGKTGTAQKQAVDGQGYSSSRHLSSFIGGAHAENPELIVLISVDEPQGADQFGGSVAAPFVAGILKEGLKIFSLQKEAPKVKLAIEPTPSGEAGSPGRN